MMMTFEQAIARSWLNVFNKRVVYAWPAQSCKSDDEVRVLALRRLRVMAGGRP